MQADLENQIRQIDTANYSNIQWIDSAINFGTVDLGEKVKLVYNFKNTGDKPLFITEVRPGCGCTVANYTKGAVLPGQQGKIEADFDSGHGSAGRVRKGILVTCNALNAPRYQLIFWGEVRDNK